MKKLGVFFGYYSPHVGGVERYMLKFAKSMNKIGYEIVIVTCMYSSDLKSYEKNDSTSIYRLPVHKIFKSRYPILKYGHDYKEMILKIKAENIDYYILNTRFHLTSLLGAKMARDYDLPSLVIEHGTGHFTIGNRVLDALGKVYEHLITVLLKKYVINYYGVSKSCNNWLKHFSIQAKGVFYNAIDIPNTKDIKDTYAESYPKNEIIITYAGRLIKEKGILNLIEAYRRILEQSNVGLSTRLVIAGDGELLEKIKKENNCDSIDILGRLDYQQVMELYKRTDIFVYPSLFPEGLPTSILEAGIMKCAVIATPKGGTEEVINSGTDGIIIKGTVNDIYASIKWLIENPKQISTYAENLHKKVLKDFNWDNVADIVDKELKEMVNK